jgi:VCBS repeat-containing protein
MKLLTTLLHVIALFILVSIQASVCFAQANVTILPLGDSLTAGYSNGAGYPGAYRNRLYTLLTNSGYNLDYVGTNTEPNNLTIPDTDHQGNGGFRIDQIQSGLDGWLNSINDPDVVLLLIGTNDFSQNYDIANIQTRMANLISDIAIKRPFAKIIVSTLPLRTDDPNKDAQEVSFNSALSGIVSSQVSLGRQVSLVNIRPAILSTDLIDGIHPSQAGYEKIADVWYTAITGVISPQGTSNPPAIARVASQADQTHVKVTFSKPVEDAAATLANYSASNGLSISQAVLDSTKRNVTLTTSAQSPGIVYTLSVAGVRDRTPAQNTIAPDTTALFAINAQTNGSFESDLTGWSATGNVVIKSSSPYLPTNGTKLVAFNTGQSTPNGTLSQSFSTTPGQNYQLQFDTGVFGYNTNEQRLQVSVAGSGNLLSQTVSTFGIGGGSTKWTSQSFAFVANSATTTLTFADLSTSSTNLDLVLDNVQLTPQFVRTLTLTSSPSSGVSIGLNPPDVNGNGTGITGFPRSYVNGTTVILTAPATANGGNFVKWQKNGADFSTSASTSVLVDGSYTFNAVYGSGTTEVSTLVNGSFESALSGWTTTGNLRTISTAPATNGTTVVEFNGGNTTPNGVLSQAFATTPGATYTLAFDIGVISYNTNAQKLQVNVTGSGSLLSQLVTVTGQGGGATKWVAQSFTFVANSTTTTLSFTDTSASTNAIDIYLDNVRTTGPPQTQRVLTVSSSPATGIEMTVSPTDLNGSGNGTTGFTRNYTDGAVVSLTAPATSAGLVFSKWQKDGVDYSATANTTVTLTGNLTLSAIYVPDSVATGTLTNGSFESGQTGWNMAGSFLVYDSDGTYVASNGTKMVVLNGGNGTPNGTISQTVATTPGQSYELTFDLGVLALNTAEQTLKLEATGTAPLLSQTLSIFGDGSGTSIWSPKSYSFVADSISTTITFTDLSTSTNLIDLLLDNVSVSPSGSAPTPTYPLTVASTPADGVPITITPADNNSNTDGATPVSRTFDQGTIVSLTAPSTTGAGQFSKWQKDGADYAVSQATSVTMDAAHTMTAVYVSAPTVPVQLVNGSFESDFSGWTKSDNVFIQSASPYSPTNGSKLAAFNSGNTTPNGVLSQAIATTPGVSYTLEFDVGALAYNTSQQKLLLAVAGSNNLLSQTITITGVSGTTQWKPQSFTFVANSSTTTLTFTDTSSTGNGLDLVLDNVRVTGPQIQRTLTVSSTLPSGVPIIVSPNDLSDNGNGTTQFTRTYYDGSVVSLTAPAISSTNTFIKWQKDGVDFDTTPAVNLTMDAAHTMTAVYINNLAPLAVADSYSTNQNSQLVVSATGVLGNDTDPESQPLAAIIDTNPAHGSVSLNSDGGFTYTPTPSFTGTDSYTYHASDGTLNSNVATVSITVNAIVASPFVNGSFEDGESGWTMSGSYLHYGSDGTYLATDGSKMIVMNGGNSPPNAVISQVFATNPGTTYALSLDIGVLATNNSEQRLGINITGSASLLSDSVSVFGNGAATSAWTPKSYTFVADSASTVLTLTDTSPATEFADLLLDHVNVGTIRTLTVVSSPATGLEIAASPVDLDGNGTGTTQFLRYYGDGTVVELEAPTTAGGNSFLKWTKDGVDFSTSPIINATLTFDITLTAVYVTNTAPVAAADSYTVSYNTPLAVAAPGILANDTDSESSALTAILDTVPNHGLLDLNADGSFTYTPTNDYAGPDSFTYHTTDGGLNSGSVTVSLTINPAALLTNGSFESGELGWTITGNRLAYESDGSYVASHGSKMLVLNGGNGTPDAVVSQTFATIPGQAYMLTFDIGVLALNNAEQNLLVTLAGNETLLTELETVTGNGSGQSIWAAKSHGFIADSVTTTITFSDLSGPTELVDLLLDNVQVNAVSAVTRTLTIGSSPASGVSISVSPADLDSNTDGSTSFNRSYANNELVTLTAPITFGSDTFVKWQKDGVDFSVTAATSITMDADHTMTAIYQVAPIASGTVVNGSFESDFAGWNTSGNMFIESASPYAATDGVKLVSFNGGNGSPNGVLTQAITTTPGTTYTLAFDAGVLAYNTSQQKLQVGVTGSSSLLSQVVTLNGLGGGSNNWVPQSFTFVANSTTTTLTFTDISTTTVGLDLLLDNVRVTSAQTQRTLTISSAPISGVAISVSPSDVSSNGNGTTQFSRTYGNGVIVTLTAPATVGSSTFVKWQKNGVDFSVTAATNVTMDANHTLTAVYQTPPAALSNGGFESGFTGWTQSGNLFIENAAPYSPTEGSQLASFNGGNGTPNGAISQTFATTPGQSYTLAFDAGALAYNTAQQKLQLALTGSGSLLSQQITITGIGGGATKWTAQSFNFIANSAATTVTFSDISSTTAGIDLVLDNVRVTTATTIRTLTVSSTPATGAAITVSPNDTNAAGNGSTTFTRSYTDGTVVSLTAPATFGSDNFSKWQKNGADFAVTAAISVTMDADATFTAIYQTSAGSPILTNGNFEAGLTAWTKSGGTADSVKANSLIAGTDGTTIVEFNSANSPAGGSLTQTFATISGTTYTLAFDMGVLAYNTNEQKLQVTATGGSPLLSQTSSISGVGSGTVKWTAKSFTFTANSTSTTLVFTDTSTSTTAIDLLLDNVRITTGGTVPVSGGNLLANGSFESFFANWNYSGSLRIEQPGAAFYPDFRTDGDNTLSFNVGGPTNGVISQSVATTIGTTYTIAFDQGTLGYNTNSQKVRTTAVGNGTLLDVTNTIICRSDFVFVWAARSHTFVANSNTTTITFSDVSTTGDALDMYLDNVRVTAEAAIATNDTGTEKTAVQSFDAIPPGQGLGTAKLSSSPGINRIGIMADTPGVYILERSKDLKTWTFYNKVTVTEPGPIEFEDNDVPAGSMFYRIGLHP